jgi:hypothetical protein
MVLIQWLLTRYWKYSVTDMQMVRRSNLLIPGVIMIVGVLGLLLVQNSESVQKWFPASIQQRIANFNLSGDFSLDNRATLIRDGVAIILDYPWLGIGGGGFANAYEKYKSYSYISNQVHSFVVQYTVEVGIIGLIILLVILASAVWIFLRKWLTLKDNQEEYRQLMYFVIPISILLHSVIDFNMSFMFLSILVFLCLGVLAAQGHQYRLTRKSFKLPKYWNRGVATVLIVISLVMLYQGIQGLRGHHQYQQLLELANETNSYEALSGKLEQALQSNPHHPQYLTQQLGMVRQMYTLRQEPSFLDKGDQVIEQIMKREKIDKNLLRETVYFYLAANKTAEANQLLNDMREKFPWDIALAQNSMNLKLQLAETFAANNDEKGQAEWLREVVAIYEDILQRRQQIEDLPEYIQVVVAVNYEVNDEVHRMGKQAYEALGEAKY